MLKCVHISYDKRHYFSPHEKIEKKIKPRPKYHVEFYYNETIITWFE